ncbi:MAG: 2-oxo acid dehydrogenase subunit E2 [Thermoanaerobaculales bacterium]|jgi:pyruvate dehydrogenase E2 component (dihydrolipoamide acetyltransferase)|nr:2-oxo acid dehydrogenase subunit E2 [Thermoanaerobaculales bacterium]
MSTTITIPDLGEGVDSVDVVAVLVAVGDTITVDQPLIEVETDKAAVEVPATAAGTVTEVLVEVGQTLGPDAPILKLEPASESASSSVPDPDPEPASADSDRDRDSESKQTSDSTSEQRQPPAPASAPRSEIHNSELITHNSSARLVPAAPTVRRFAREVGIDIAQVAGTGPGGRISIDDVKSAVAERLQRNAGGPGLPKAELPDFSRWGEISREPMSKIRTLTAEAMSRAWLTAPQVTNHDLADVTELEATRRSFKARVEAAGGKLTTTAILVKVVASALIRFPTLNASIDQHAGEIVFKEYVNIGVAVDTEHGLLVPVIQHADEKNITEIAVELTDLAGRARSRKLKPDEMQGGTFSISNLGGIGGTGFSPIVNWPEVAILGVSRSRIQPEWEPELDDFEPRLMMPLSLSYDHRLVDGADAARFLRWFAEALETPLLLALEG